MNRRSFLKNGSILSLPMMINGWSLSALAKPMAFQSFSDETDKVLVLIQLNGGNDGLNTLLPIDRYDILANLRSNVIVPENSIIALSDKLGLHPSMTGVKSIFDQGKMAAVQSVGYPNQNRSHFRSTDIWTTGSASNEFLTTGWLGRYMDNKYPDYPEGYPNEEEPDPFALTIGSLVSDTCQGIVNNFSMAVNDPYAATKVPAGILTDAPDNPYGTELTFLRETIEQTNAYADTVQNAANNGANISTLYADGNSLAQQLKTVALLLSGGLQTKIFVVNLGGFDTHANQVEGTNTTEGDHASLLYRLSEAVTAFQDDLQKLGIEERVLTVTFSEFGRRIRSNAANGTDHGDAAPLFLFGSCVKGGILGDNPIIDPQVGQEEGVAMQYDFRSVYGTILVDWFKVEEQEVRDLLYEDFQLLPLLGSCGNSTPTRDYEGEIVFNAYPSPFTNYVNIDLETDNEFVRISLFDSIGHEVRVFSNKKFSAGQHSIQLSTHDLAVGNYFLRIQMGAKVKTTKLIKA